MHGEVPAREVGILAIEASQGRGSVAWSAAADDGPHEEPFSPGLVHGRELLPRVELLRTRIGFARSEIGLVAVSAGPGSFTGTRIGVAAGKAIAYALGVPALAISSLETLAANVEQDGEIAVLLDARRGQVYGARFRRTDGRLERSSEDQLHPADEFLSALPDDARLLGDAARTVEGAERFERLDAAHDVPHAARVATLARERLAAIEAEPASAPIEFKEPHALIPAYLRRTAAEEAREGQS